MLAALVTILLAYILGSMPFGYWTAKVLKGIDIRQYGSGSTGATNVWRIVGKAAGVFVFFADLAKGAVPVLVAHTGGQCGRLSPIDLCLSEAGTGPGGIDRPHCPQ